MKLNGGVRWRLTGPFGMTERLRSRSGDRRHRTEQAYGCFLPDLTRFTADPCIGPDHDRSLMPMSVLDNGRPLHLRTGVALRFQVKGRDGWYDNNTSMSRK